MDSKANISSELGIDPTPATDHSIEYRRCDHCQAQLPLQTHYGVFKPNPRGYARICKQCRSEMNATRWTKKYGRKRPLEPAITRGVLWHNRAILTQLITMGKTELRGFDTQSKVEYKIFFGPSERHGMDSLACFTRSGSVYFDYAFSGLKDSVEFLLHNLKGMNIRLEWTDMDMITSKNEIYYL